ncbi:MAG: 50S ribosomal protein L29 [Deltaproteobacteria bacterium]|jgi:large subunit ribosomal protein L29|nr:50S ribosomal protein L29 [Deltaproteobacteria bacterium]
MKAKELRDLAEAELATKGRELRDQLWNARMKKATGQLENHAMLRTLRRDIARVETVLREKRGANQ